MNFALDVWNILIRGPAAGDGSKPMYAGYDWHFVKLGKFLE